MKLEVNIDKKYFFIFLVIGLILVGLVGVVAYNSAGNPSDFGHSVNEVDWSQTIANNVTAEGFCIGANCVTDWSGVGGTAIPAGAVMFFNLASCPAGWSELTSARGRYLVGLPANGTLAYTVGTALLDKEDRGVSRHTHTGSTAADGAHDHSLRINYAQVGTWGQHSWRWAAWPSGSWGNNWISSASNHNHGLLVNYAGTTSGTSAPYIPLLVCQKD